MQENTTEKKDAERIDENPASGETSGVFKSLPEEFQDRLLDAGITTPTKVQEELIPKIISGSDTVFQSETGTGKTLAYLLPTFARMLPENENPQQVELLIVAPTFELASQIKQAAQTFGGYRTVLLIGGSPIKRQQEALKEKPRIAIGTAARMVELIRLKKLKTQGVRFVVFDEVDRLVKKELIDEIRTLDSLLPDGAQRIACTATVDEKTKKFFKKAETVILPQEDVISKNITHWAFYAESRDKIELLRKLLNALNYDKILVFTSRADQVENIHVKLKFKKINCSALHAKTDRGARKATIDRFRSGKEKLLVTSDLSARGLDIPGISHIIQMDLPDDDDFFVHRSGRTARAGKKGVNIVIGDEYEMRRFAQLEKKLGIKVFPKEIRNGKITAPSMEN